MFKYFWNVHALPDAQYFGWRVLLNKVPTMDKLISRRVHINSLCELCNEQNENVLAKEHNELRICVIVKWKLV